MPEQNLSNDAPGDGGKNVAQSPAALPAAPLAQPKVEIRDGVVTVDGKKYVPEHQLIGAKESSQKQLETAQVAHNEAVDKLRLQVSDAQQAVAKANAALDEAKKARATGAMSDEDIAKTKKEAEDAKTALTTANTTVLDLKRKLVMSTYNIPPDSEVGKKLAEKNMAQIESFEEALKALGAGRGGAGNYALGGGAGGAAPANSMDRAKTVLANTPVRGIRTAPAK